MGLLDTDLDGTTRTGTAGAVEATEGGSPPPAGTKSSARVTSLMLPAFVGGIRSWTALTTELTAQNSNDVDQSGSRGDWISHAMGVQDPLVYRTYILFDLSTISPSAVINGIELDLYCSYVTPANTDTGTIGPYNGNGQANPVTDSGSLAYSRCEVSADYYITASTQFQSTGQKTFVLGAQAVADLLAAKAVGNTFAIAIRQDVETTGSNHWSAIEGYTTATPPVLRLLSTSSAQPTITNAGDEDFYPGETGIVITGTNFGASQGTGHVELNTASDGSGIFQNQTVTSWSDTSITITISRGSLSYGALYLIVTNGSGQDSDGYAVTLSPVTSVGSPGDYGVFGAYGILDANVKDEVISNISTASLNGDHRIGVGDIRLPIKLSYSVIQFVYINFHSIGNGWAFRVVDYDVSIGPRIQIFDADGNLSDVTLSAQIRGL